MTLRVVAADDEPLSLRRLVAALEGLTNVELVGTARNGREAIDLIRARLPDIAILDIEMPVLSGLDVASLLLGNKEIPVVIFLTAYDRFAIRAFEIAAVDYLMKPLSVERLQEALGRAARMINAKEQSRRAAKLERLLGELHHAKPPSSQRSGLWIQKRGERFLVDQNEIDWLKAQGDYVEIHTGSKSFLHRQLLKDILSKLDAESFLRIHRSVVVRIDAIAAIRRTAYGGANILLRGGAELPVGRTYAPRVRARLRNRWLTPGRCGPEPEIKPPAGQQE